MDKKRVAVFTTSRAEFGILSNFIKEIEKDNNIECCLFVGGTHLASEYGSTKQEIINEGVKITATFDYLMNGDTAQVLTKSAGLCMMELSHIFQNYEFDFVVILGDRFELIPIALTSVLFNKIIIHIGGGEVTEGVIDEQIRHMVSKAAHLHFVASSEYGDNIRKMGESEWRIFNVGAPFVDHIKRASKIAKSDLFEKLGLKEDKKTILFTYHPVTLEYTLSALEQIENVFRALEQFDFQIVITSPNMEAGRETIMNYIKEQVQSHKDYHYFDSLGIKNYHSMLPNCEFVIGNSSSGIFEAPFFKIPTVNIGDRQKGRYHHKSVINTDYSVPSIVEAIQKATSNDFNKDIRNMEFMFGDGTSTQKMIEIIKKTEVNQKVLRKMLDFPK